MMKNNLPQTVISLTLFSLILSSCGSTKNITPSSGGKYQFQEDKEEVIPTATPYVDKFSNSPIDFKQSYNLNQEFKAKFQTVEPSGEGEAEFKARSLKSATSVGDVKPDTGKKFVIAEISVRGNAKNKGLPSTFNQIGDYPSPQFVLVDKKANKNYVEETYFSDIYTVSKNLFELSKITTDGEQWVHTAIVFHVDQNLVPDLAFRFTGTDGKITFYDIKE